MKDKQYFVYVDLTKDENIPFYVGRGTKRRIKCLKRNKYHDNIANKHGINRFIIQCNSLEQSKQREKYLIEFLHTFTNDICSHKFASNFTLGGEGTIGQIFSIESRQKMSESHKGKKCSEETKLKMSQNNATKRPDVRKKISESNKGNKHSEESKRKMSEIQKIVQNYPENRIKRSESRQGKKHPMARAVQQIDKFTNEIIATFDLIKEASESTGIHNISSCCQGKCKHAGGFIWRYVDE